MLWKVVPKNYVQWYANQTVGLHHMYLRVGWWASMCISYLNNRKNSLLWTILLRTHSLNLKVTWRTKNVLHYFQSKFEGIVRVFLEKINKERLYKPARSTQRHQKQQIWGWCVISMKLKSFRLSCNTKVLVFPGLWLPTWFMCTKSLLAEDLPLKVARKFSWSCTCYGMYCGCLDLHISHFTNSPEFM